MVVSLDKYRKKIKYTDIRTVPRCKYEYNDPNEKFYWRNLINEVEKLAKKQSRESRLKNTSLWKALPPKLHARVSKFIKVPPDSDEEVEEDYTNLDDVEEPREMHKPVPLETFNESTLSEILEQEREYREIKLKIDSRPEMRAKPVRNINWMADYVHKKQKDRILWKSKMYKLEKSILEKSLFEQAEEIMDRAAENFANWVNNLGKTEDGNMTKDMIKDLFSIEMAEGASAALQIAPKEIKAVPHEVAMRWNLPQMSLEMQVEKHFKEKKVRSLKKPMTVAFGRTLPVSMREWYPTDTDQLLQPVFPEELRTKETLFKGISHLRSTRALVEHYLEHENLKRPQYLVDIGSFKPQAKEESAEYVPLYERFRTKKM